MSEEHDQPAPPPETRRPPKLSDEKLAELEARVRRTREVASKAGADLRRYKAREYAAAKRKEDTKKKVLLGSGVISLFGPKLDRMSPEARQRFARQFNKRDRQWLIRLGLPLELPEDKLTSSADEDPDQK